MSADHVAATRTVTGVMAAMVATVAGATAVGFWLSYGGLHAFAWKAGLRGPESWAWPSAVDLFIAAGETGAMIAYLRRRRSLEAWLYLVLGFGASATFNVSRVVPGPLPWPPYVAAAVPPVAAMAALAALLRVIYALAVDSATDASPEAEAPPAVAPSVAREVAIARSGERGYGAALTARAARDAAIARSGRRAYAAAIAASARARQADRKRREKADKERTPKRPRRAVNVRPGLRSMSAKQDALKALIEQPDMSAEELSGRFGVTGRTGRRWREKAREMATATPNGTGHE